MHHTKCAIFDYYLTCWPIKGKHWSLIKRILEGDNSIIDGFILFWKNLKSHNLFTEDLIVKQWWHAGWWCRGSKCKMKAKLDWSTCAVSNLIWGNMCEVMAIMCVCKVGWNLQVMWHVKLIGWWVQEKSNLCTTEVVA